MKTLADLTAPAAPVRKLLEKDVQKQCVEWARARGYWARKFSSMTQRSVPDYILSKRVGPGLFPKQLVLAVEFKKPGNMPTDSQKDEMELMRKAGWKVFWCDTFEIFKAVVTTEEDKFAQQV